MLICSNQEKCYCKYKIFIPQFQQLYSMLYIYNNKLWEITLFMFKKMLCPFPGISPMSFTYIILNGMIFMQNSVHVLPFLTKYLISKMNKTLHKFKKFSFCSPIKILLSFLLGWRSTSGLTSRFSSKTSSSVYLRR